jgi:hypothetical protein
MTAQNDLDRALGAWFDGEATATPPPEPLARALESTRTIRPHPALTARVGSRWVGAASTSGPWIGVAGLRPAVVVALVALLALALVGSALLVGSFLAKPPTLPRSGYDAIFLRAASDAPGADIDIVAVRPDGEERLVKRLTASILPDGRNFSTNGSVSQDGWIAVGTQIGSTSGSDAWALIDLADPTRAPRLVPYEPVIGAAWGPHGLFATEALPPPNEVGTIQVVDAATGTKRILPGLHLPGGGPDIIWAADGSGLLVVGPNDTADLRDYAIVQIDGSRAIAGVPALAPRLQSRWVAPGGPTLDWCKTGTSCLDAAPDGTASISGPGGVTEWYSGELAPARLLDASLSADGRSIWLLLDRVAGTKHVAVVAHADSPGAVKVVGSADLGEDLAHLWFGGFAPDDSTIAIGHWTGTLGGEPKVAPVTVMRTSDTTSSAHSGNLIGFVPAPVTDAWPGRDDGIAPPDPTAP